MVLSRSAFGRRGAYLPSALCSDDAGWIGVNTYFPVKISMAFSASSESPTRGGDLHRHHRRDGVQVVIGIYGFYAIRTFEKYTVAATVAIMALMSVLAGASRGCQLHLASTFPWRHLAMLTL